MKKVQLELSMDELLTIIFGLRKAIFYTEFLDPTYYRYMEMPDKKEHLDSYRRILLKFVHLDCMMTNEYDELLGTDMADFYHVLNAEIVERPDEDDNDNNGKGKQ